MILPKKDDEGEEAEEEEEDVQQVEAVLLVDREPTSRSLVISSYISLMGLNSRGEGPRSLQPSVRLSFRVTVEGRA